MRSPLFIELGVAFFIQHCLAEMEQLMTMKTLAISEVEIKRGTARATDESLNPAWKAEGAFIINHPYGWNSGGDAPSPVMIWYEFPSDRIFVPARVSFRSRQDCCLVDTPTMWQFVGSNDEECGKYGSWTVLCEERSNIASPNKFYTRYCEVDENIYKKFRCLGISVLNTRHTTSNNKALKDVRMWKKKYE